MGGIRGGKARHQETKQHSRPTAASGQASGSPLTTIVFTGLEAPSKIVVFVNASRRSVSYRTVSESPHVSGQARSSLQGAAVRRALWRSDGAPNRVSPLDSFFSFSRQRA